MYLPLLPVVGWINGYKPNTIFIRVTNNSIIGGSFIIAGLYTVTWGSYRERRATVVVTPHGPGETEPLILDKTAYQIGHIFSGPSSLSPKLSD